MGLGTIILIVVIVLLILGIGFSAFWDALVRGFNIVRDRAEEFVDEQQQSNREETSLPQLLLPPTLQKMTSE
jgi:flagellar basal body-associated protein FliL